MIDLKKSLFRSTKCVFQVISYKLYGRILTQSIRKSWLDLFELCKKIKKGGVIMAAITKDENLLIGLVGCAAFFQQHRKEAGSLISNPDIQKKLDASERLSRDKKIDPSKINYYSAQL